MFKGKRKNIKITLLVVGVSLAILSLLAMNKGPDGPVESVRPEESLMPVSAGRFTPGTYRPEILAMAEALPLRSTVVYSPVSALVDRVSPDLEVGQRVEKGALLIELDRILLNRELKEAESRRAAAALSLMMEEREAKNALINWEATGMNQSPDSPLAFREPQLEAARAELEAAEAGVQVAMDLLERASVRAPYEGVVLSKEVNGGDRLEPGDPLFSLYSTEALRLTVGFDNYQWSLIGKGYAGAQAFLKEPFSGRLIEGRISGSAGEFDPLTRQRALFVRVDNPMELDPPVLPGSFFQVIVKGEPRENLLRLPRTCLTGEEEVWFIDEENRIESKAVSVLFFEDLFFYIKAPERDSREYIVALSPHSGFLKGLKVDPVYKGDM